MSSKPVPTPNEGEQRLAALYRVSRTLGASLNLDEVLNQVMDAVIELTEAERGFLMLIDPGTGELDLRAARNIEKETLEQEQMEVSRGVIQEVVKTGEGVVTTNAQKDPRFAARASVVLFALRSILCTPLRTRGKIIGVIYVDNRIKTSMFEEDDIEMLNAFSAQAAVAIENARLYTQTDAKLNERVEELVTLSQIDRDLTDDLELEKVLERTRSWAIQGTSAAEAWVAIAGRDNPVLQFLVGPGTGRLLEPSHALVKDALETGLPKIFPKFKNDKARLVIPLQLGGVSFGVLITEFENKIPEQAAFFLTRLAARAASAIDNARLYQAVQDASTAKSKFVSVVSHELRIPMTSIKGYTDLMLKGMGGEINEMQLNFLNVIKSNVERMSVLVSDLSDISRMETGRMHLEPLSIPFHGYLNQIIESMRPQLEEKKQTLLVDVPDTLPRVIADPNRTMQVASNLLRNANKYSKDEATIHVHAEVKGEMLYVEVKDNGIGISEEDQSRLFQQFFRSEHDYVRQQPGWGLGLDVSKRLVELMGGEIGAASKLGEGSTFWFTLPLDKTNEE